MVVLRLSRVGKKSHATWRLIVSDKRKDTFGTYLELLGSYDPHQKPAAVQLKADRIKYWLSVGAQPSPTVHNLLIDQGILPGPKPARKQVKSSKEPIAPEAPVATEKPAEEKAVAETEAVAPEEKPVAEPVVEAEVKKEEAKKAE